MLLTVTLHSYFVTPNNRFEVVVLTEALRDIGAELETYTSLARASSRGRLRIRPEHLHH